MKNFITRKNKSAFTLIELLTVITILAILMGLSMAIISFAQGKAAEDKTRGAMSAIKAGLERYKVRNGEYPEPMENSGSDMDLVKAKTELAQAAAQLKLIKKLKGKR